MTPEELKRWTREILSRLDVLKTKCRDARQYLEANGLRKLRNKQDVVEAWQRVQERFPEDLNPPRVTDLNRHLEFAMPHDFSDIETLDIPAIDRAVDTQGGTTMAAAGSGSARQSSRFETTSRWARRLISWTTASARPTAKGESHRVSNASCTQSTASSEPSSHSSS